jgi:hypothetical protein
MLTGAAGYLKRFAGLGRVLAQQPGDCPGIAFRRRGIQPPTRKIVGDRDIFGQACALGHAAPLI